MSPLAAEIFEVRNCFRCLIPLMHFYLLPLPIFIHKTVKGGFLLLSALVGALSWSVVVLLLCKLLTLKTPRPTFLSGKTKVSSNCFCNFFE